MKKRIAVKASSDGKKAHIREIDDITPEFIAAFGDPREARETLERKPEPDGHVSALPIAQTNSPKLLSSTLESFAHGVDAESMDAAIGVTERTAQYYVDGLVNFGFVYPVRGTEPFQYDFTEQGAAFLNAAPSERALIMAEAIQTNPDVEAMLTGNNDYFESRMNWSDGTRDRRMNSLSALAKHADDLDGLETEMESSYVGGRNIKPGTRPAASRSEAVNAGRAREKKNAMKEETCMECFMKYNAALDACPNCF